MQYVGPFIVNDGENVERGSFQVMRVICCYNNLMNVPNLNIKSKKNLITYYKFYGIIIL